jgi:hypothetical protein
LSAAASAAWATGASTSAAALVRRARRSEFGADMVIPQLLPFIWKEPSTRIFHRLVWDELLD